MVGATIVDVDAAKVGAAIVVGAIVVGAGVVEDEEEEQFLDSAMNKFRGKMLRQLLDMCDGFASEKRQSRASPTGDETRYRTLPDTTVCMASAKPAT